MEIVKGRLEISDELLGTFAPIIVYWVYSGIYVVLGSMENFRLHSKKDEDEKNLVPKKDVVIGVLLQQLVQAVVATLLFALLAVIVPIVGIGAFIWWAGLDIVQSSCPNCGNEFQVFKSTLNDEVQLCPLCTQPFSVEGDKFVRDPVTFSNQSTAFDQLFGEFSPQVMDVIGRWHGLCKQNLKSRQGSAAKSIVSGLVLVSKACENDVPRLTFWLSNSIVLRVIMSKLFGDDKLPISVGSVNGTSGNGNKKSSTLKWDSFPIKGARSAIEESFGDWENPLSFVAALEKVEAWIFSRIIESIWWQTFTPHIQSGNAKEIRRSLNSEFRMSYRRTSIEQQQGSLSMELWKKSFQRCI